jgi:ABC-type Fe3+-citrate transport system substrate-binding protein
MEKVDKRYKLKRNMKLYKDKISNKFTIAQLVGKYKVSQQRIKQICDRLEQLKISV